MLYLLSKHFPTYNNRNVLLYYLLHIFGNAWFVAAIWVFFFLKYMSGYEVGLFDALDFGAGMLVDIPSSARADLVGKKPILILSFFLMMIGTLLITIDP